MSLQNSVQLLPVKGGHILDIAFVLEPSFDFKGDNAGSYHLFKIIDAAHILQRQQMLVADQCLTIGILQVETGAADLGALTPITASARHHPADITLSAVTDAQSPVYECFQFYIRLIINLLDSL